MRLTAPIVFEPIFMDRVWGGRRMETHFGKRLPTHGRIGESWEIVDRAEAQSVVHNDPLRGSTLHELWTQHRADIFGGRVPDSPRFPLLFKLLDAQERLSVQVHPPAAIAPSLNGEPKTEMWYILDNYGDGDIFAGLRPGVTRESFEAALRSGSVQQTIHRVPVAPGDCIFIPSGRVHAIGAGNVIVEVQQNSDTTYRVFDWNRVGLDGKMRELHIEESLKSIDFQDFEPRLQSPNGEVLVDCPCFHVEKWSIEAPREAAAPGQFAIFTVLSGSVQCCGQQFHPGQFLLIPAALEDRTLHPAAGPVSLLRTTIPG
ncbi:MAG TPA: type I phosphomannose isomerase catalytic subunit [Chthoniobacteraceae bacterium]|jgi:mannose-6-phosphate isomerase|nr:type I phosphomannose isomerase catalytic subunit [Chthoniobacteraceae bacterium]